MLNSRDLSILTLAVCMYLVSNYVMMPINNILGIPSVVLIVGLFMGILKGYSKYFLYVFSILSCIPEMYIEYEKDLITNRSFLEIYVRTIYGTPVSSTEVAEPSILGNITLIAIFATMFVFSIKYIYINYKKIFNSLKLVLVMFSLPMFLLVLPLLIMFPVTFYFDLFIGDMFLPSNIDKLTWLSALLVVARSFVVLVFGPIYGYFVFKTIGLYKRLGLEN